MIGGYSQLVKYKGMTLKVYVTSSSSHSNYEETGVLTNLMIGTGENGAFIELDNEKIINIRYIIKMEIVK